MATGMRAIQQLEKRALSLEAKDKKKRAEEKATMEKVVGFSAAFVSSAVAGYVDGRLDLTDDTTGDGTRVFGIPVVPVAGALVAAGGMAMGGSVGSAMAYSGLGIGCGWAYQNAARKGLENAQKASEE